MEDKNRADFMWPSERAYHDFDFPAGDWVFLTAKTTARDHWRQIQLILSIQDFIKMLQERRNARRVMLHW